MSRVIVVYKKSTLEYYKGKSFIENLKKKNSALYAQFQQMHDDHYKSVELFLNKIEKTRVPCFIHERGRNQMPATKKNDLIVTIGGDGTFIYASHYVKDAPMLGINSAPDYSIGYYCNYNIYQDSFDLNKILNDYFHNKQPVFKPIHRITYSINGKESNNYILNDILITDKNPATTSRYILQIDENIYSQKSSGIWVSSASGSGAAYKSAGGKPFKQYNKEKLRQFAVIAREVYSHKKENFTKAIVHEKQKFEIISAMIDGMIYIDGGQKSTPMQIGDKLNIYFSENPLNVILDKSTKLKSGV